MGKIRVSKFGDEQSELEQKKKAEARRYAKKAAKVGGKVHVSGLKGGERIKTVGPTEADLAEAEKALKKQVTVQVAETTEKTAGVKKAVKPKVGHRVRSRQYQELIKGFDQTKHYDFAEAVKIVKQIARTKFTGSVEAHFNLTKKTNVKGLDFLKTERKFPLAHAVLGKTNDPESKLMETFEKCVKSLGGRPSIQRITISATMSPGVKVS